MTHKFMKMAGVKNEKDFYKKYPTEDHFFAAFPQMEKGGPIKNQWDLPSDPSTPGYEDYGDMYTVPQWPGLMYKDPGMVGGWEGFGNPANLVTNQPAGDMGYGPVRATPTRQLAMDPSDYSIDKIRAGYAKEGGYSNPPGKYWDGTKFVKSKNSTWDNSNSYKKGGVVMKDGKPCYNCGGYQKGGPYPKGSRLKEQWKYPDNIQPGILKGPGDIMEEFVTYPGDTLTWNQIPYAARDRYMSSSFPNDNISMPRGKENHPISYQLHNKDREKIRQYTDQQMGTMEAIGAAFGYTGDMPAPDPSSRAPVNPYTYRDITGVYRQDIRDRDDSIHNAMVDRYKKTERKEQGGKFNYRPFERKNGYYTFYNYIEDGGNIAELRQGGPIGYVPANINTQPQILKQTDGVYHMEHGGPIEYIPAPMTVHPAILKRTNGVAHMKEGGIDNPGFRALPVAIQEKIKARMEFGGVHMPTPMKKDGGYWKYYGYDEDDGNIAELKEGGIHIAPSKRGTFTAAATKHGKSVQAFASQVLANKENYSPAMVKKANFARNAAKWKHEYGGPVDPMDEPMPQYAMGGHLNPFSTIAQFAYGGYAPMMQTGGGEYAIGQYVEGKGYWDGSTFLSSPPGVTSDQISPEGSQAVMLNAPSSTVPTDAFKANSIYDNTVYNPQTDPNNPVNNPPPMPPQGGYAAAQGPVYEGKMEQPQMIAGTEYLRKRPKLAPILGGILGGIATGAGIVNAAKKAIDAKKNDINRGGSWNMASVQGSKGYSPNVNRMTGPGSVISQPGNFAPYRAQMGGMMSRNNMYQEGGIYDMDDAEIADLISKGYKVEYI